MIHSIYTTRHPRSPYHLWVAEDGRPFAEGEVGGDDDRDALVEPAHEVEEQLPAGLGEGQVSEFVEDAPHKHWLAPGAAVVTDGLGCWSALDEAACSHRAIRTGSGRQAARMASFKWVNTTLGNIKSAITGTYRKLGPDHAGRYLASFAWRYNRRYQLQTMIPRFVHSAARNQPMPYRLLIAG